MSQRYRTAFAVPSGFSATAAVAPKPAVGPTERKPVQQARPTAKPGREAMSETRKPSQAA